MRKWFFLAAIPFIIPQLQAQSSDPLSAGAKSLYTMAKNNVLKSAEEMPESGYSFKPTDSVRTFGQLVGHVADGQYEFCSSVVGDDTKAPEVEKSKTTKADLMEGLKTAFDYCDKAYNGLTDAQAASSVKFFGRDMAKLTVLNFNTAHTDEHYGNMVTYLRMKGLVPPSSKK
ncbi:MAG: DinB family protein [Bryobacteraceae bacterium]|jgi:uncharacterized damage-inducible protein DinB